MSKSAQGRRIAAPRSPYLDRPHDVPAVIGPLSPELLDYLAAVRAHYDAHDAPEPRFGSTQLPAWEAAVSDAIDARNDAKLVIQSRPIRSWRDFVELVLVVRQELWQREADGRWEAHSQGDDLQDALARACFLVIEGGVHV
jgi:hypothetical protein